MAHAKKQDIGINFKYFEDDTLDSIRAFCTDFNIDLIITSDRIPKTNDKLFLDNLSGSLVKTTEIPVLIIPKNYQYK